MTPTQRKKIASGLLFSYLDDFFHLGAWFSIYFVVIVVVVVVVVVVQKA
jgi:hypothetical protein